MYKLIIRPTKAMTEIISAVKWYRKYSDVAADNFRHKVLLVIEALQNDIKEYAPLHYGFSGVHVDKYPYTIFFDKNRDTIL